MDGLRACTVLTFVIADHRTIVCFLQGAWRARRAARIRQRVWDSNPREQAHSRFQSHRTEDRTAANPPASFNHSDNSLETRSVRHDCKKADNRLPAVCSYFPVATDNSGPNTLEQHEWVLDQHGKDLMRGGSSRLL